MECLHTHTHATLSEGGGQSGRRCGVRDHSLCGSVRRSASSLFLLFCCCCVASADLSPWSLLLSLGVCPMGWFNCTFLVCA